MFRFLSGIFMGWSLGSNDSANVFGTAVASKSIKYKHAVILCSVFILIGALLEGSRGMHTLSSITRQTLDTAFIASFAAAMTVFIMTTFKLPVSTSQAMVGAIIGIGIMIKSLNFAGLQKVVICWIGTPVGGVLVSMVLYFVISKILNALKLNIFTQDYLVKIGLILAGCYGAYALGANNVANVTGIYIATGALNEFQAALLGGISIVLGVVTYSKKVMLTVGSKIVNLDPFAAFIAVLAEAIVVHIYAIIGVPVSTSQAIIGAVIGIGFIKGLQNINFKILSTVIIGWILTPLIAGLLSVGLFIAAGFIW